MVTCTVSVGWKSALKKKPTKNGRNAGAEGLYSLFADANMLHVYFWSDISAL